MSESCESRRKSVFDIQGVDVLSRYLSEICSFGQEVCGGGQKRRAPKRHNVYCVLCGHIVANPSFSHFLHFISQTGFNFNSVQNIIQYCLTISS
ncbi:hypothetical protein J6590_093314 [Homalodisca vitripennis]|nr:hypothetical protein J6590_093314 [Homalodisca vitripennis]